MTLFERVSYEVSPVIYLMYAGAVMIFSNKIASAFAFLLFAASYLIIFMRIKFRLAPPHAKAHFMIKN